MILRTAVILAFGALFAAATTVTHAQATAPLSYTIQQAEAGQVAYAANCVACHGPHLADGPTGAPLKGPVFMAKYGGKSVAELFNLTSKTMPTANPGSLDPLTYAALVAFILKENAIVPGEVALPADPQQLAQMKVPGGGFSIMAFSPYTAQKVVTLPNSLDHFTPVGAADLTNPPPQDWLTWRRGWNGHGFSPLTQISTANASGLRLVWSWTLPAGSTDERQSAEIVIPAPSSASCDRVTGVFSCDRVNSCAPSSKRMASRCGQGQ